MVASAGSDKADCSKDYAGGIVASQTVARAEGAGIDISEELGRHNSSVVLMGLGDSIFTGIQKTNAQDLRVIYVGASRT